MWKHGQFCKNGMQSLAVILALLGMLLIAPARSQEVTGGIAVNVSDTTGALVWGASLTLTNKGTNSKLSGTTSSNGIYSYNFLQPGEYSLTVDAPGFKSARLANISVHIGEHFTLPVKMEVGAITQSVEVSAAGASLLNSESASVGQAIQSNVIEQLPLNGRNFVQLLNLATGVQPVQGNQAEAATWTGRGGETVIVAGLRESDVSYLVNGIETRNPRFGNPAFLPSVDAIQEFRVQRTTFGPEFGLSASVVNLTLRGGTNGIHGDVFELNRNRDYAANNYFLNQAKQPRPPLNQNNFGATMSGPLWIPKLYDGKDKTFWMFNYEGFRQVEGTVLTGLYPSKAQLAGNLADDSAGTGIYPLSSGFCSSNPGSLKCANVIDPFTHIPYPGNVIPTANLDPVDQKALPYFATPNVLTSGGSTFPAYNTIASPSVIHDSDQYNARFDQRLTDKDTLYATFSNANDHLEQPSLKPLGKNAYPLSDHLWTATYVHIFSPSVVNEFRLGLDNSFSYLVPETAFGPDYAKSLFGLQNTTSDPLTFGIPDFNVSGLSGVGSWGEIIGATAKNYQLADNVSVSKGAHNYQAGVQLMHQRFDQVTDFGVIPGFSFDGRYTGTVGSGFGLGDFLIGTPIAASGAAGDSEQDLHTNYYGLFAQDHWQVRKDLLLSYGLRYEYSLSPVESKNRQGYFDLATGQERYVGDPGVRRSIVKPDYLNFAPRLGFTWQPRFLKDTVVRGGYGIYYGTDNWNELQFSIVGTKFYETETINSDPTTPTISMENMLPPFATSLSTDPFTLDPNSKTEYYEQWGLDLQKVFAGKYLFELEYAGNVGKDLLQRINPNTASIDPTGTIPIAQRSPYPNFGFILEGHNEGASNYNALTAKVERRYQNGFSFLGSLTYSNAIDQGIEGDFSAISSQFKLYDRGHSDSTVPLRFVGNAVYELPFGRGKQFLSTVPLPLNSVVGGWQLNTITTIAAGPYSTATLNTDWLNIGAFSQSRPNVDRSSVKQGRHLPTQYFNPAAFSFPSTHIEGNVGRNTLEQPGAWNSDLSLFKGFSLPKETSFQLRFEFFNVFNHTQFGYANTTVGPGFGQITSAASARVIQLGGRLQW